MAATFYIYDNNSLFKGDFSVAPSVKVKFLDEIVGEQGMAIINTVSVENNEVIQFFLTFDDVVNWFFFGSGLGNITITGMLFTPCTAGGIDGLHEFYRVVGDNRGKKVEVSIGSLGFNGVITNFRTTTSSDPELIIEFQLNLAIVEQVGLKKPVFEKVCD